MFDGGAVLGVNHRRSNGQTGERLVEALLLQLARSVAQLRGMKVREYALWYVFHEKISNGVDAIPLHAGATHAGVDREMPRTSRLEPPPDCLGRAEGGCEIGADGGIEVSHQERREDQDRPRDRRAPQLFS